MVMGCSHNFFHQADNFRMFYFDLSPLSSSEWRISHGLSHHLYTNTLYDFEISILEPFMHFLPEPKKKFLPKFVAPISCHLTMLMAFNIEIVKRAIGVVTGKRSYSWRNLFPWAECLMMMLISGSFSTGFW